MENKNKKINHIAIAVPDIKEAALKWQQALNMKKSEIIILEEHGVKVRKFSDELYDTWAIGAKAVFDEVQAHSDLANEIYTSFAKARDDVGRWKNLSEGPYYEQRNRALGIES